MCGCSLHRACIVVCVCFFFSISRLLVLAALIYRPHRLCLSVSSLLFLFFCRTITALQDLPFLAFSPLTSISPQRFHLHGCATASKKKKTHTALYHIYDRGARTNRCPLNIRNCSHKYTHRHAQIEQKKFFFFCLFSAAFQRKAYREGEK